MKSKMVEIEEAEIWKDVVGYEGLYEVSNMGRVKSIGYKKIKILKLTPNNNGYLIVTLSKDKKQTHCLVHRLVATAFVKRNQIELNEVNHIDEHRDNNRYTNLEWVTHKQNCNYGTRNERLGKLNMCSGSIPIIQTTMDDKIIKIWRGARDAKRKGEGLYESSNISSCLNGKLKSHANSHWYFLSKADKIIKYNKKMGFLTKEHIDDIKKYKEIKK